MAASRARIHLGPVIVDARVDGDIVRTADGKSLPVSDVTFAPPCQPSKVICVGFKTARDVQQVEKQWVRAKAFDASAPLGPWIATGLDPAPLDLVARVNGEVRQSANTRDMIFGIGVLRSAVVPRSAP